MRHDMRIHSADWYTRQEVWDELEASANRDSELGVMLITCGLCSIGVCLLVWAILA